MKIFKKHFLFIFISSAVVFIILSATPIKNNNLALILILISFAFFICLKIEIDFNNIFSVISGFLKNISEREFKNEKLERNLFEINPDLHLTLKEHSEELTKQFNNIENEKNQFKTILEAMNEGVVIISSKGNILLINNSAKKMFELDSVNENKPYWEIIRNKDILDIIEISKKSRDSIQKEISTVYPEEKFYLINIEFLDKPSDVIIVVIFDITEFKKLEKIKADLIANVSHELRTPLTSMKGYIETLIDEAYDSQSEMQKFLNIINNNTDRLINIVSDLLVLSELEVKESKNESRKPAKKALENININELVSHSMVSLASKIAQKKLIDTVDIQTNIPDFKGDKFLIEQMLTNLIDNAVKYTPDNGYIKVNVYRQNQNLMIEVSDSGIGVPKEHHDRIFERFYRVDKDRSRKIGGTGLGLSIVKHIVLQHKGNIKVESEENSGSTFIVQLPYSN